MESKRVNRVVVKVGSSTLTHESTGKLNLRRIDELAAALSDLKNSGRDVVLVTSGAVAAGMARLGMASRPESVKERQAAAAVGQCALLHIYDKVFAEYGQIVGQILMTKDNVDNPHSRGNLENTFDTMFACGVIPVVNENDAVSTYELENLTSFGDNDRLSAYVAVICKADLLVLLSDFDGMFDADPRKDKNAKLIPVVREIDEKLLSLAGGAGTGVGTGGAKAKLQAARIAMDAGIDMVVACGGEPGRLLGICEGKISGTLFVGR